VEEKPKIALLKPRRYVIATSVGLSPIDKEAIMSTLTPYVLSPDDIIGAGDLDSLLSKHPTIERANFKLWLTSTSVIERVLHNAEVCQTEFEVERIRKKLPLFVHNQAFPKALALLNNRRIAVISGPPGIGKTTLAEMLLFTYLEQGYEPVVIQAEFSEGKKFFRKDAKRIFYYDDFLGQINLGDRTDYLGQNQDAALSDFMQMVRDSEHARFILTTRAHILAIALQLSERLSRSAILDHRCVLELSSYTFGNRARILYNHLFFSGLPTAYKQAVLHDDFFIEIIKHEHFNPRLIEWLSTDLRRKDVSAEDYRAYIKKLLISPHDIWLGAFRNQLSDAARDILLSFYTLGEWIDIIDLEPVFRSVHRHRASKYNRPTAAGDFRDALRELDGAFLSFSSGRASYLNPSIRDFMGSVIRDDHDTAEDLLHSSIRFKQVETLKDLADEHPESPLAKLFANGGELLAKQLAPLIHTASMRWEKSRYGMSGYSIDLGSEARIGFLAELADRYKSTSLFNLSSVMVQDLIARWNGHVPEFTTVIRLLERLTANEWFLGNGGSSLYETLLHGMIGHLEWATASDWLVLSDLPKEVLHWNAEREAILDRAFKAYCDGGYEEERSECSGTDDMTSLKTSLEELGVKRAHNFGPIIKSLEEDIAEAEEEERSETDSSSESFSSSDSRFTSGENVTEDDVRQMFDTLCEI
jgi:hypothetical protein